jgi:asparagine synthase (glutamine-hydrolysing)
MCGIAGVASRTADPELGRLVEQMNATIVHRGPDEGGVFASSDGHVALGSRRLAIIDLAHGQQPMSDAAGRRTVVCNGEIYNFQELRAAWSDYPFGTHSDTEAVLASPGLSVAAPLRGMFGFARYDHETRTLVLGRDRFGKKPLFYAERGGRLYFGSELKALLAVMPRTEADPIALTQYLILGYIPGNRTPWKGVSRLPPGHELFWSPAGKAEVRRYWQLPTPDDRPTLRRSDAQWEQHVHDVLKEAVRIRLISEVPLGAFLSGGVDSSTIVALCRQFIREPFHTFSIRTRDGDPSDADAAHQVSKLLGTTHHEVTLDCPTGDELISLLRHFDEPFGDSSLIPTAAVSALARQHVTVSLSGDGGDELFGGYGIYRVFAEAERRAEAPGVQRLAALASKFLPPGAPGAGLLSILGAEKNQRYLHVAAHPLMFATAADSHLCTPAEWHVALQELNDLFAPPPGGAWLGPVARAQYVDTARAYLTGDILSKVDIAAMRHSLEVRCPLLDHVLAEEVSTLPAALRESRGVGKVLLKRVARRYLPAEIVDRQKKGFSVPLQQWLSGSLRPLVRDTRGRGAIEGAVLKGLRSAPRNEVEAAAQYRLLSLAIWSNS